MILVFGFRSLPPIDYLYTIHPEYAQLGTIPTEGLTFGHTLLFDLAARYVSPAGAFVPPMNEIYHYPFLCVGWFGLFVTAMNLIPIGQLDGGHISRAMFGEKSHLIGQISLVVLVALGTIGLLPELGIDLKFGWVGWLFWALLLAFFLRSSRSRRAHITDDTALGFGRFLLGCFCFLILVGSLSLVPVEIL
jgi:hypothetical protein